jgi:DNA polymerase delta subunit 1
MTEKNVITKLGSLVRSYTEVTPSEKKNGITFQAISWASGDKKYEPEEGSTRDVTKYDIYITGNYNGKSIGVRVINYKLFFYLHVPDTWKKTECTKFYESYIKKKSYGTTGFEQVSKMMMYPFTNFKKFNFMKIYFKNRISMSILYKAFDEPIIITQLCNYKFTVYEGKVDPLNKFCHEKNIKTTGYITIKNFVEDRDTFNTQYRIEVDAEDICAADDMPTNSNFRIFSYDIETQSSREDLFPDADISGDYIGQIGISMWSFVSDEIVKIIITRGICDPIPGVIIFETKSEKELIMTYFYLVKHLDPDIITGYNIWSFDDKYIVSRAKLLGIYDYIGLMTRINENLGTLTYLYNFASEQGVSTKEYKNVATVNDKAGILKKNLSTSAYGDNTYWILIAPGRETVDLIECVRKEHKLENYRLETVGTYLLKKHKVDLAVKDLFILLALNDAPSNKIVAEYCIQDTNLVVEIIKHQLIVQNYIEMAKLTYVPIFWLTTRGQQCRVYSLIVKFANLDGYLVPDSIDEPFEKFQGATVLKANRGRHYMPVCGLDFASLYPSIMRAHNICLSTIYRPNIWYAYKKKADDGIIFEDIKRSKIEDESIIVEKFYQPVSGGKKGPIPQILDTLAAWRKEAKNSMAKTTDQSLKDIYNSRQLSIKIVMNSVYGFFGSKNKIACISIASSVTARGREMIHKTANMAEEIYPCDVLYGDSIPKSTKIYAGFDKNSMEHVKIGELVDVLLDEGLRWSGYKHFKSSDSEVIHDTKEQINIGEFPLYTISHNGPAKIKRIIRHKTTKKLYKIKAKDSAGNIHEVIVTEGHSLIDNNGYPISAEQLRIGQELPEIGF